MSRALETALDSQEVLPGAYVLEISSPGISRQLSSEREFQSFKGFAVIVTGQDSQGKPQEWRGKLQGRDEQSIYLNQKGRSLTIDRTTVISVRLDEQRDHQ
jgi:ribosome maturation factor RimP